MTRYFLSLAYNGTKYHGWQLQPNANTVQNEINKALKILLKSNTDTIGAGRTDTGVHASYFVLHFDCKKLPYGIEDFIFKLNRILPKDIVVFRCIEVTPDDHARFSAVSRSYQYYIHQYKNPFHKETSFFFPHELDIQLMNEACVIIKNTSDFTSFSKLHTDVKTNICKVMNAQWVKNGNDITFQIEADRFLRNMVRALTGTFLDIGRHKISLPEFREIIEDKNRGSAGISVAAHGLFLTDIKYDKEIDRLLKG